MKYHGIIYKYTNTFNGKVYIGQTLNEEKRYREHKNSKRTDYFHTALRKYGFDNFNYEVLIRTASNSRSHINTTLDVLETFYIKKFKSNNKEYGYNLTEGGEGRKGSIITEETRKKLSIVQTGENNGFYGKHHTEETKEKLRNKIVSEETKLKLSESHKGNSNRNKVVLQYTLDGMYLNTFNSAKEAANSVGTKNGSHITECCNGKLDYFKGYRWKY